MTSPLVGIAENMNTKAHVFQMCSWDQKASRSRRRATMLHWSGGARASTMKITEASPDRDRHPDRANMWLDDNLK